MRERLTAAKAAEGLHIAQTRQGRLLITGLSGAQELLTRAHSTDMGPETTRLRMLLCVEEAQLFEAGRQSVKAVESWR